MSSLRELLHMPMVTVDGKEYVDKELFVRYLSELIDQERKDCTEEQRDGLDMALIKLYNIK